MVTLWRRAFPAVLRAYPAQIQRRISNEKDEKSGIQQISSAKSSENQGNSGTQSKFGVGESFGNGVMQKKVRHLHFEARKSTEKKGLLGQGLRKARLPTQKERWNRKKVKILGKKEIDIYEREGFSASLSSFLLFRSTLFLFLPVCKASLVSSSS